MLTKTTNDPATFDERRRAALVYLQERVRPDSPFSRALRSLLPNTRPNNDADDAALIRYELLLPLTGTEQEAAKALILFDALRVQEENARAALRPIAEKCEALLEAFPVVGVREQPARFDPEWCARVVRQRHDSAEAFDLWRTYAERILRTLEA